MNDMSCSSEDLQDVGPVDWKSHSKVTRSRRSTDQIEDADIIDYNVDGPAEMKNLEDEDPCDPLLENCITSTDGLQNSSYSSYGLQKQRVASLKPPTFTKPSSQPKQSSNKVVGKKLIE